MKLWKNIRKEYGMDLNKEENLSPPNRKEDSIVKSLVQKFWTRSSKGVEEYGMTLDDNRLSVMEWSNHLQEELMDASLYLEKIRSIAEKSDSQIAEMQKNIRHQQMMTNQMKDSINETMNIAASADLQPHILDLLKFVKNGIENIQLQLEIIHGMASSRYMRILKNKEDE